MAADAYSEGFFYERFIIRAFNCPQGARNGAHAKFMENAITMEQGKTYAKQAGSAEKQFEKVRGYISKALVKFSKTKPYKAEAQFYLDLNHIVQHCRYTDCLMEVARKAVYKANELEGR